MYHKVKPKQTHHRNKHAFIITDPSGYQQGIVENDLSDSDETDSLSDSQSVSSSILEIAKQNHERKPIKTNNKHKKHKRVRTPISRRITNDRKQIPPPPSRALPLNSKHHKQQSLRPPTPSNNSTKTPSPTAYNIANESLNIIPPPPPGIPPPPRLATIPQQTRINSINTNTSNRRLHRNNNSDILVSVPSEKELQIDYNNQIHVNAQSSLSRNLNRHLSVPSQKSIIDHTRRITDSSTISTLLSRKSSNTHTMTNIIPPPPPLPMLTNEPNSIDFIPPPPSLVFNDERPRGVTAESDRSWNYAYSYASSTVLNGKRDTITTSTIDEDDYDEKTLEYVKTHKQMLYEYDIRDLKQHNYRFNAQNTWKHVRDPSLYMGMVTPNPIEVNDYLMSQAKLPGPMLLYRNALNDNCNIFALPVQSISIDIEMSFEIARIRMSIIFVNHTQRNIENATFALPLENGRMDDVSVRFNGPSVIENRLIEMKWVDTNETQIDWKNENNELNDCIFSNVDLCADIEDLFRLPMANIENNHCLEIECEWTQRLRFYDSLYNLVIPLTFVHNILASNVDLNEIVVCKLKFDSLSLIKGAQIGSNSHNLIVFDDRTLRVKQEDSCRDIEISYYILSPTSHSMNGLAFMDIETKKDYILCLNASNDRNQSKVFAKDIMFLIDREKAMIGTPYSKAIQGLGSALASLQTNDRFGVTCFDAFDQMHLSEKLMDIETQSISKAKQFLCSNSPSVACSNKNTTDVVTPLCFALETLNKLQENENNKTNRIPFVVLITNGRLDCEDFRELKRNMLNSTNHVRILTFGIGNHCNMEVLKQLSSLSRGWSDYAIYAKDIKIGIESLIYKCCNPFLKDLSIDCECNGEIFRDLFVKHPCFVTIENCKHYNKNNGIRVRGTDVNLRQKMYNLQISNINFTNIMKRNLNEWKGNVKMVCFEKGQISFVLNNNNNQRSSYYDNQEANVINGLADLISINYNKSKNKQKCCASSLTSCFHKLCSKLCCCCC